MGKSLKLTLIKWENIQTLILPPKVYGNFWIKNEVLGELENLINIEGINNQWFLRSGKKASIVNDENCEMEQVGLKLNTFYKIVLRETNEQALIFTEPITENRQTFSKYLLPKQGVIRLGKLETNEIVFKTPFISRNHATISINRDQLTITDENSANGIFVNGKRIAEGKLTPGDSIYIMGLVIVIGKSFIAINNPDNKTTVNPNILKRYPSQSVGMKSRQDESDIDYRSGYCIYRVPRFKREIQAPQIRIDAPPNPTQNEKIPIFLLIGPTITMGMTSVTFGVMAVSNVVVAGGSMLSAFPSLMMSAGMLAGTVLWPTLTRRHEKKQRIANEKHRVNRYTRYLNKFEEKIENEIKNQGEILNENFKKPQFYLQRIVDRKSNLWERTSEQDDFLEVRLGLGQIPLEIKLEYPQEQFTLEEDDLKNKMYQLVKRPKLLENVPITLSLKNEKNYGFLGNFHDRIRLFKSILVQLVTLHSYDSLNLVFLYSENQEELLQPLKWLPHTWNSDKSVRFIGRNQKEIKDIGTYLEKEISKREVLNDEEIDDLPVKILIFVMDEKIGAQADFLQRILDGKKHLGISILSFYRDFNSLSKECSKVIEIREGASKKYDKEDTSGSYQSFNPDLTDYELDLVCRSLADVYLGSGIEKDYFPTILEFLDMYKVGKVEHLNCLSRWAENDPTLSLEAMVGVNERGETFGIDFHEKYHGPHGLVAGMTGSGKSEFIITFILSMAVNYHPNEVAFILIDYKGGGMADIFRNLPHLAGTITNLDGSEVKRSLISIQSEITKRQAIFKEAGLRLNMSNIDIYDYQKLYREKLVRVPLQHLFIISDEFAELKMQQPDFMDQLVSAARIGRSLGIHLILATQKPSGVVDDQIWSNSRLKICLKVQEKADSMDMIKRGDAAELKNTGRFFMQVGFNELFELGQSAWSGAPYYPEETWVKSVDDGLIIIDRVGQIMKSVKIDNRNIYFQKPKKQTEAVVSYLESLANEERIVIQPLWLPPLKPVMSLLELRTKYQTEEYHNQIKAIIGEYDDPANQRQGLMEINLSQGGNTIVYGSPGSGKLGLIQTMIYSLLENYSSETLNLYLLDFGSETLNAFKGAPQVGDVLFSTDNEAVKQLFKMLSEFVANRKRKFANYGGNLETYNKKSGETLPNILVVIENYTSFCENYDELEENLGQLTREGMKYGIFFVITATAGNSVRYRIVQNFKQNLVLQLNDQNDYAGILGNINGIYPSNFKGRGIFKHDTTFEFQTATIVEESEIIFDEISTLCRKLQDNNYSHPAPKVPVLPEFLTPDHFIFKDRFTLDELPLGLSQTKFTTVSADLTANMIFPIFSQNMIQKSYFDGVVTLLGKELEIKWLDGEEQLYPDDGLEPTIIWLFNEMVKRNNAFKDAQAEQRPLPEFDDKLILIRGLGKLLNQLSEDGQDKLKLVLEKGEASYRIFFIIADEESQISNYSYDSWCKKQISGKDGVWIGNGFTEQFILKASKTTREMYESIAEDAGYYLKRGQPTFIKVFSDPEERS